MSVTVSGESREARPGTRVQSSLATGMTRSDRALASCRPAVLELDALMASNTEEPSPKYPIIHSVDSGPPRPPRAHPAAHISIIPQIDPGQMDPPSGRVKGGAGVGRPKVAHLGPLWPNGQCTRTAPRLPVTAKCAPLFCNLPRCSPVGRYLCNACRKGSHEIVRL